jgi:hypothetical protein
MVQAIPYRSRHHVALREEVAFRAAASLLASIWSFFFLAAATAQHQWMWHLDSGWHSAAGELVESSNTADA